MEQKEYTLKQAAKLLNKSVRTLRRYLDKCDNYDKNNYCRLVKGKLFVNAEFINFVKVGQVEKTENVTLVNPKKVEKKEPSISPIERPTEPTANAQLLDTIKAENKRLVDVNNELRESIKDKDEQIKENIKDFKTLTNAVLHLQNELKQLATAPAPAPTPTTEQKQQENTPKTAPAPAPKTSNKITLKDSVLFLVFILLIAILIVAVLGVFN